MLPFLLTAILSVVAAFAAWQGTGKSVPAIPPALRTSQQLECSAHPHCPVPLPIQSNSDCLSIEEVEGEDKDPNEGQRNPIALAFDVAAIKCDPLSNHTPTLQASIPPSHPPIWLELHSLLI